MAHQVAGVDWLIKNKRGILYWVPGSGKTLTALEALHRLECKNVLIVAPVSLLSVWSDELKRFYDEPSTIIRGTPAKRFALWYADGIKIVGYETLRQDFKTMPRKFNAIVLDEAAKIACPVTKITKRILQLDAPVKIVLNGTLLANSIGDLWSPCEWLERGVLFGNWYHFRAVHAVMNPYIPGAVVGWRNVSDVEKKCAHLISRKTKEEVLTYLPPVTEQVVTFQLSPKERAVYERIRREAIVKIRDEDMPVSNALVELTRLKQTTNGTFVFGENEPSSKIRVLKELIETLPVDAKAVIFSNFKTTVDKIVEELPGALKISGDVLGAERDATMEVFRTDPTKRFLVMTSAGEKGLNVQTASYLFSMDLPWTNASHEQRIGRLWRTGQKNHVHIYILEAEKTVDVKCREILEKKKKMADDFQGYTQADLSTLLLD